MNDIKYCNFKQLAITIDSSKTRKGILEKYSIAQNLTDYMIDK